VDPRGKPAWTGCCARCTLPAGLETRRSTAFSKSQVLIRDIHYAKCSGDYILDKRVTMPANTPHGDPLSDLASSGARGHDSPPSHGDRDGRQAGRQTTACGNLAARAGGNAAHDRKSAATTREDGKEAEEDIQAEDLASEPPANRGPYCIYAAPEP
jgi:hypothetical protein